MAEPDAEIIARLLEEACVPMDAAHTSGTLEAADAILASHPELARLGSPHHVVLLALSAA
jgi:hypothetical protein